MYTTYRWDSGELRLYHFLYIQYEKYLKTYLEGVFIRFVAFMK